MHLKRVVWIATRIGVSMRDRVELHSHNVDTGGMLQHSSFPLRFLNELDFYKKSRAYEGAWPIYPQPLHKPGIWGGILDWVQFREHVHPSIDQCYTHKNPKSL